MEERDQHKKALLINWDAYPNIPIGGIYSWSKALVETMSDWEFLLLSQLSNANANSQFNVPRNVSSVIQLPIFGSLRREEFLRGGQPMLSKIIATTDKVISQKFQPIFQQFLTEVLSEKCDPTRLSDSIANLHAFLTAYDSKKTLENPMTWETFYSTLSTDHLYSEMQLRDAVYMFQVIQREMQLLSIEVPRVDLIHCSVVWLPALAAIPVKKKYGCPFMVTEHGVAFRNLLFTYNINVGDQSARVLWEVFAKNIVSSVYSWADVIVPVCNTNAVWEKSLGADSSKIKRIYNGIDTNRFAPREVKRSENRPTLVSVGRVDVFKDITCLIEATKYVKQVIPDVQCLIYGTSSDLDYSAKCVNYAKDLGLTDTVKFMGGTDKPDEAYNSADVVVFTFITEGFPFTVIEAMACGRAIVAADVGGVREALGDAGILVKSRNAFDLAEGITKVLQDSTLRSKLGTAALDRARTYFTLEKSVEEYRDLYNNLTKPTKQMEQVAYSRRTLSC